LYWPFGVETLDVIPIELPSQTLVLEAEIVTTGIVITVTVPIAFTEDELRE
jgi:hypothetical protein